MPVSRLCSKLCRHCSVLLRRPATMYDQRTLSIYIVHMCLPSLGDPCFRFIMPGLRSSRPYPSFHMSIAFILMETMQG